MAATENLPKPPPNGVELGKDELVQRLDKLLEHYLNTLDDYQQAQKQLTSYLSSGYMSLAQANFNNAARTRYGQDYYDERMQATRKVSLSEDESDLMFSVSAPLSPIFPGAKSEAAKSADAPDSESAHADSGPKTKHEQKGPENVPASGKAPPDPIRWFGILVPSPLRSAQSSFVAATEESIPRLATLAKTLRQQEIEIGRLRKQIKKL